MHSNYVRRGRYLVPRNSNNDPLASSGSVRRVSGVGGTTVMKIGPSFAEPAHKIKNDPEPGLMAELEQQVKARQGT